MDGCGADLGTAAPGGGCRYYNAIGVGGQPAPRIPVHVHVAIRMQSPARMHGSLLESR